MAPAQVRYRTEVQVEYPIPNNQGTQLACNRVLKDCSNVQSINQMDQSRHNQTPVAALRWLFLHLTIQLGFHRNCQNGARATASKFYMTY